MSEPFLRLDAITKAYPGVQALKGVSFEIGAGEVVGLIGENGAGKSTLMKVLGGVVAPTSGSIVIDGVVHPSLTVTQSLAAGIAFVHQELNLFDNLDAAANIFIGREPRWGGPLHLIDQKALHLSVAPLLKRLGCDFKPDTSVADLSIAQRQMLEITKALSLEARVIIMDEPTSSLTLAETDRLLAVIADLKASGVAIIFISHRLNEVERSADRVVVLRDGEVVGKLAPRRNPPRPHDPPDDRARSTERLHSAEASARRGGDGARGRRNHSLSRPQGQANRAPRRDPRPRRPDGGGTH